MTMITGTVYDASGSAAASRTVRAYRRDTGALLGETTSDSGGAYSFTLTYAGECNVVALDDSAGTVYNDLILRTTPFTPVSYSYRYWRLNVTANNGDTSFLRVAEIELLVSGVDQTTGKGGTATASSENGGDGIYAPSKAFDDDLDLSTGCWLTASANTTGWVTIDLGSVTTIDAYSISAYSHAYSDGSLPQMPKNWTLQGSNTSQTGPWDDVDTKINQTGWVRSEKRTFTF